MKTYTFRISLTEDDGVWRRIELTGEQSLRDLHVAIQEALDWEPDDDIAFILQNEASGQEEEYILFGDEDDETDDEESEWDAMLAELESEEEAEIEESIENAPDIDFGDIPRPETMEDAIALVKNNPAVRQQMSEVLSTHFGIPHFMVDIVLNNLGGFEGMMGDEGDRFFGDAIDTSDVKDAAATPLDTLALAEGRHMVYAYGDDEWSFKVMVEAVHDESQANADYPLLLDSAGDAPMQFAFWGNDDSEDAWDDADEDDDED